ncbi:MAG: hypothetical protein KAT71_06095 [Gammaproteobacteria bacterium]|nr:hypothetical protein [Gammaproteobacteria bacterium]
MIRPITKVIVLLLVAVFATGCVETNKAFVQGNSAVDKTQKQIEQKKAKNDSSQVVVTNPGYYVNNKPIPIENNPAWLSKKITFQAHNLPFSFILDRILRNTNAIVSYRPDVSADKAISMDYSGTIQGALDNLAMKSNYAYDIKGKQIVWSNFVTRTFDVSFMPGASNYMVGQTSSGTQQQRGDVSAVSGTMSDQQYSSLKGSLSVWDDLKKTLNGLKSKEGTVNISESTTNVLVRDHPSNMRAIAKYIKELNEDLSRQVELKVQVLEVDLDQAHQYGIDWNIVENNLSVKSGGNLFGSVSTAVGTSGSNFAPVSVSLGGSSNVLLQSLGQQGKVSVVTQPTVVTLNNQVAEVRITTDTSYLEEMDQSVDEGTTSTSMTPGVVTSGFMLYILPKIQDNRVYLQVSSVISDLKSLDTIDSNGSINGEGGTTPSPGLFGSVDSTTIQVPTLSEKRFNMRSVINNDETLIIAGFKQLQDKTAENQTFDSTMLGGRGVLKSNVETIILITPTIIENTNKWQR